ncbi:hypothetical protein HHI36_003740 [Cryptolaemus montrouzieri]|uniref:SNF2 N-terminal domain-containing protein n=1 Tax=Cryptolaemus montrouzieri TaxID=559131 RepID=A0ABD2PFR8_9CUCU
MKAEHMGADASGLGKTLTMITLVLSNKSTHSEDLEVYSISADDSSLGNTDDYNVDATNKSKDVDDSEDLKHKGGTLIICYKVVLNH